jgi:hypothetical protein
VWERREGEGGGKSTGARDFRNSKNNMLIAPHGQESAQRRGMMQRTRGCDIVGVCPAVKENEGDKVCLSCKNFCTAGRSFRLRVDFSMSNELVQF